MEGLCTSIPSTQFVSKFKNYDFKHLICKSISRIIVIELFGKHVHIEPKGVISKFIKGGKIKKVLKKDIISAEEVLNIRKNLTPKDFSELIALQISKDKHNQAPIMGTPYVFLQQYTNPYCSDVIYDIMPPATRTPYITYFKFSEYLDLSRIVFIKKDMESFLSQVPNEKTQKGSPVDQASWMSAIEKLMDLYEMDRQGSLDMKKLSYKELDNQLKGPTAFTRSVWKKLRSASTSEVH